MYVRARARILAVTRLECSLDTLHASRYGTFQSSALVRAGRPTSASSLAATPSCGGAGSSCGGVRSSFSRSWPSPSSWGSTTCSHASTPRTAPPLQRARIGKLAAARATEAARHPSRVPPTTRTPLCMPALRVRMPPPRLPPRPRGSATINAAPTDCSGPRRLLAATSTSGLTRTCTGHGTSARRGH